MSPRWELVDLDRAETRIVNGKTRDRTVYLSPTAVAVLKALPRQPGNTWVVPGAKPGTHMADIDGAWQSIRAKAGLHDVRIHDRHSFASRALALGEGLPIIGRLLGHRRVETMTCSKTPFRYVIESRIFSDSGSLLTGAARQVRPEGPDW